MTKRQLQLFARTSPIWKHMPAEAARPWFERFLAQRLDVRRFCKKAEIDVATFSTTMRRHFPDEWKAAIAARAIKPGKFYDLGRRFEYRVMKIFKARGFHVLRAAGSKGPADVIALKTGMLVLVQCKRGGDIGPGEWNVLWALARSVRAIPVLADMAEGRGTNLYRITGPKEGRGPAPMVRIVLTRPPQGAQTDGTHRPGL